MDDELSGEECEFFVRRLTHDAESRSLYMRYQLIGSALRGEHIAGDHARFRTEIQAALSDDTAAARAGSALAGFGRWAGKVAAGAGIAAAVAAAAIVYLQPAGEITLPAGAVSAPMAEQRLERLETPSYVVPLQVPSTPAVTPQVRLTGLQYLMYHGGHASGLSRTVAHTNVLAADNPDIVAVAEEATAR